MRSIIRVHVTRVSDSCGYGVPFYDHVERRPAMENYIAKTGAEAIRSSMRERNRESLDGLPALETAEVVAPQAPIAKPAGAQ